MTDFVAVLFTALGGIAIAAGSFVATWFAKKAKELEAQKNEEIAKKTDDVVYEMKSKNNAYDEVNKLRTEVNEYDYRLKTQKQIYENRLLDANYLNGDLIKFIKKVEGYKDITGAIKKEIVLNWCKERIGLTGKPFDHSYWGAKIDAYVSDMNMFVTLQKLQDKGE